MPGSEGRFGDFLNQVFFWVHSGTQLGNSLTKDTETEPLASFLRNGQRWRVIFDTVYVFEETWSCWDQYTGRSK